MFSIIKRITCATLLVILPAFSAHANSVGFDSPVYTAQNGQISVTVVYDYSDFPMSGGGFDFLYDASSLELVSVTLAPRAFDVMSSSTGVSDMPGIIRNANHSTEWFTGISSSGDFMTVVFNVLSNPVGDPGCDGFQMCLVPTPFNPLINLTGFPVTEELLMDAQARVAPVPVPAAFWLFASGLLGVLRLRKTS